jgi:hypothetical protein
MKLSDLKMILTQHPEAYPRFVLPDGDSIPAHFHITEVGHTTKRFIDCGGKLHDRNDTCLLQTYVADDTDHRLTAGTFVKILRLGDQVLPGDDLDVEVEWDCCVVSQYPIVSANAFADRIEFQLASKQTDCLAKTKCGTDGESCGSGAREQAGAATACC